jgi:serine/threonine protein kinase
MNVPKNPWSNSWEVLKKLGKGGQGETSLVKSISDPNRLGVLKTLKNNRSPQARARFQIEVSILEALAYRGIKVPTVFESNTDRFKDEGTPLYFVMQYIEGRTLEEAVRTDGPLSLERASAMILDLGETMAAAHNEGVFHRDLKPANIIVRNAEAADLVVVDYGLSFNSADDVETLTKACEQFRNEFLALGETNTPGGNKRDLRIDVTALCAVLYFCLTGHFPGQILDGRARPPHRRDGARSIRHHISDDYRCNQVEMVFDRGFASDIERRFQTCSELTARLRDVLAAPRNQPQDPTVLAAFFGQQLQERDRKTQLELHKVQRVNA